MHTGNTNAISRNLNSSLERPVGNMVSIKRGGDANVTKIESKFNSYY